MAPPRFFLVIAAGLPLAALYSDSSEFPELEGNWIITSERHQPTLHLPEKFRIERSGLIRNVGLVGRGICGKNCYTLHLLQTGTEYRLIPSADGEMIKISAAEFNIAATAIRGIRKP